MVAELIAAVVLTLSSSSCNNHIAQLPKEKAILNEQYQYKAKRSKKRKMPRQR